MSNVMLTMDCTTDQTPSWPDAARGDCFDGSITETRAQLDQNLVWEPCAFCGLKVLIRCDIRGRERCSCGAVRCHHRGQEGWRRGDDEWWLI